MANELGKKVSAMAPVEELMQGDIVPIIRRTGTDGSGNPVYGNRSALAELLKGQQGERGPQGPAGPQGPEGETGSTPVKGVDYWTEDDRQGIIEDTLNAMSGNTEEWLFQLDDGSTVTKRVLVYA